jgi:hypothetical protein
MQKPKFRKAVIIVPPISDFYFTRHRFSSIGAQIAATLLERAGIQVDVLNFPLMNPRGAVIDVPEALNYLNPFLMPEETGPLSFFTAFRRFGPTPDECLAIVEKLMPEPEICFFSVFAFCYSCDAIELARKIRTKMPSVILVAGGGGPAAYPGYFLRKETFDFVLTGEAEVCLTRFIRELSLPSPDFSRVPDLAWKDNGTVRVSPLREYTPAENIELALVKTAESSRHITLSTSLARGCPKQCDFCSSRMMFGQKMRSVPFGRLEEFLAGFSSCQNDKSKRILVNFEDDNLLCDPVFFTSAVNLFKKHIPGVRFVAENGLDYSLLTPDLCEWLAQSGMSKFNISLASIDRKTLELRKRFIDQERYEKTLDFLTEKNIPNVTYFICGFKEDTLETTSGNLSYMFKKQTVIGISMFYAVPGLPGFTDYSMFDKIPASCCCGSAAFPWNNSLSTETMITAFRLSRYANLKKKPAKSEKEVALLDVIEKEKTLHTIIKEKSGKERIAPVPNQDKELVSLFFRRIF